MHIYPWRVLQNKTFKNLTYLVPFHLSFGPEISKDLCLPKFFSKPQKPDPQHGREAEEVREAESDDSAL